MKTVLLLCLLAAACAPAHLSDRAPRPRVASPDLARAFGGATDEVATRSLGNWIAKNHNSGPSEPLPGYHVTWHPGGPGIFAPGYFDRLEPARRFNVSGLQHHRADGSGVPLVGFRENRGRELIEKWYPPEGITRAVTAVAIPGSAGNVEIRLIERMRTEVLTVSGKPQPLAADFTVPFTALSEKTGPLQSSGIPPWSA